MRIHHILILFVFGLLTLSAALLGHEMLFPAAPIQSVMVVEAGVLAGFFTFYLLWNRTRHRTEYLQELEAAGSVSRVVRWVLGVVFLGMGLIMVVGAWQGSVTSWYLLACFYAFALNPACHEGRSFWRTKVFAWRFGVALVATVCLLGVVLLR